MIEKSCNIGCESEKVCKKTKNEGRKKGKGKERVNKG